jgi:hypothetical protein
VLLRGFLWLAAGGALLMQLEPGLWRFALYAPAGHAAASTVEVFGLAHGPRLRRLVARSVASALLHHAAVLLALVHARADVALGSIDAPIARQLSTTPPAQLALWWLVWLPYGAALGAAAAVRMARRGVVFELLAALVAGAASCGLTGLGALLVEGDVVLAGFCAASALVLTLPMSQGTTLAYAAADTLARGRVERGAPLPGAAA